MKVDLNSPYIKYELDDNELLTSQVLSDLNIAGIQNLIASTAEDLLNIPLNLSDVSEEGKNKRAFTQGMLLAYKHILELHNNAKALILEIERSHKPDQGE